MVVGMKHGPLQQRNLTDNDGNPAGGYHVSTGCTIIWQDGPLGRGDNRKEPNGAFVESVISAALDRIRWYQTCAEGKFFCLENTKAIKGLEIALVSLNSRTSRRESQDIEGTHVEDSRDA